MQNYIDLKRSFQLISKDYEFNEEEYEIAQSFGLSGRSDKQGWDQLLDFYRVIILAEAGAGKTEEIRATTESLRTRGKNAFFFRLEHLSTIFSASFEIGNMDEFEEWLSLEEEGWFFLDSVDEARLVSPKNFEDAIRSFAFNLGEAKQRAHIYITSRPSE